MSLTLGRSPHEPCRSGHSQVLGLASPLFPLSLGGDEVNVYAQTNHCNWQFPRNRRFRMKHQVRGKKSLIHNLYCPPKTARNRHNKPTQKTMKPNEYKGLRRNWAVAPGGNESLCNRMNDYAASRKRGMEHARA